MVSQEGNIARMDPMHLEHRQFPFLSQTHCSNLSAEGAKGPCDIWGNAPGGGETFGSWIIWDFLEYWVYASEECFRTLATCYFPLCFLAL